MVVAGDRGSTAKHCTAALRAAKMRRMDGVRESGWHAGGAQVSFRRMWVAPRCCVCALTASRVRLHSGRSAGGDPGARRFDRVMGMPQGIHTGLGLGGEAEAAAAAAAAAAAPCGASPAGRHATHSAFRTWPSLRVAVLGTVLILLLVST